MKICIFIKAGNMGRVRSVSPFWLDLLEGLVVKLMARTKPSQIGLTHLGLVQGGSRGLKFFILFFK